MQQRVGEMLLNEILSSSSDVDENLKSLKNTLSDTVSELISQLGDISLWGGGGYLTMSTVL